MSSFICDTCGKEKNTGPVGVSYDNKKTCWECMSLNLFNEYSEGTFEELKEEIKKYMLESPYTPNSNAIFIISYLLEFFKNRENISDFNRKFEHLEEELKILNGE